MLELVKRRDVLVHAFETAWNNLTHEQKIAFATESGLPLDEIVKMTDEEIKERIAADFGIAKQNA